MDCIIIEDEGNAAERLENQLSLTGYDINVLTKIDSVEEAVPWLKNNNTDLIFLDIHLGDGLGFEIFDHVQVATPVIFTTSYDQYMARAFEVNSISYLLKPIVLENLIMALDKYKYIQTANTTINQQLVKLHLGYQQRFLVKNGSFFIPINMQDVAFFHVQDKRFVIIHTKGGQQHLFDSTMEILEQRLDPSIFFRINRQFIISYDTIQQISVYDTKGRLKLITEPTHKEEMIVSRYKAPEFRNWLNR